jgi:AbrB family looped-hinge helix DNA binding protein
VVTVDSEGRVVLPQDVRERLDISPGTEVTVRERDGVAVVEPENDPERVIERMEALIEDAPDTEPTPYEALDPRSRKQVDNIREQADAASDSGDD